MKKKITFIMNIIKRAGNAQENTKMTNLQKIVYNKRKMDPRLRH